jgi:hypothetical protein
VEPKPAFVVDPDRVVHETIDGETVLINLERGTYHSLSGSGPEIWALGTAGAGEGEIVEALCERHGADRGLVVTEVARLLGELAQQGLVAPVDVAGPAEIRASKEAGAGGFAAPVLQSFDDMQYLLLLDPIHDFEASDWPSQPARRPDGRAAA